MSTEEIGRDGVEVKVYNQLFDLLMHKINIADVDNVLAKIELLAEFAWKYNPNKFSDYRLEKLIYNISDSINKCEFYCNDKNDCNKIIHIASELYNTGGHTRLLFNIIKRKQDAEHSIIVTRQSKSDVPSWLAEAVQATGGDIYGLHGNTLIKRVEAIRRIIANGYSSIMLHIHPDDAVALAAVASCAPQAIVFVNHADHVFCLGTALVDVVACFRKYALDFTLIYRHASEVKLLPLPIEVNKPAKILSKTEARECLRIANDEIVILSVASAYKYIPNDKYNFFQLINKIIEKYPHVVLKIIGVSKAEAAKVGCVEHERIELLGYIENPYSYYVASDIYLDSMPVCSATSTLEGAYYENYPVLQFTPDEKLANESEPAFDGVIYHACSNQEWLQKIEYAINNVEQRAVISSQVSHNINYTYMGEKWMRYLEELLATKGGIEVRKKHLGSLSCDVKYFGRKVEDATFKVDNILVGTLYKYVSVLSLTELAKLFTIVITAQVHGGYVGALKSYLALLKAKISI